MEWSLPTDVQDEAIPLILGTHLRFLLPFHFFFFRSSFFFLFVSLGFFFVVCLFFVCLFFVVFCLSFVCLLFVFCLFVRACMLGGGHVMIAAETGSGKTGAFAIPVVQLIWEALRGEAKLTEVLPLSFALFLFFSFSAHSLTFSSLFEDRPPRLKSKCLPQKTARR